jgi:ribosomal protein L22
MADEEKEVEVPARPEGGEEPKAATKPAAKKAPAAQKDAAEKAAAAEKTGDPQKPAAKEAPEKKPAASKAEAKDDTAATEKPAAEKKPASKKATPDKPVAEKQDKPSTKAASSTQERRRVVRAHARYVRTSARKARMVCGQLRGKSIAEARAILAFTPRAVARDWSKLLESAVANAENNHELLEEDLVVRDAFADEGPTIKRFRPRAMGRATPIRKRTSHLTITLTPAPEPGTSKKHG